MSERFHETLAAIRADQAATRADVGWIREAMERGTDRLDKHDTRIGSLERWRTWSAGIGATIAGILGVGHLPKL